MDVGCNNIVTVQTVRLITKLKNSISFFDAALLFIALLFTFFVFRAKVYDLVDNATQQKNFTILTFSISYSLFLFQYKALRKRLVYLCWTILSLILLFAFFFYYDDTTLNYIDKNDNSHNNSHGLICPFIVLIWYQVCRQLSLKFCGFELGMPSRVSSYIIEEKRNATIIDRICAIGMFLIPAFSFLY
jgi:hypothetical protein